jgi:hypothetical protein
MKKIILIVSITVIGSFSLRAQKLAEAKVPEPVRTSFKTAHPAANPVWEKEEGDFEASFSEGGKEMSCVLNNKGIILETETEMIPGDLPKTVLTYLDQHYKGKKIQEAAKIVKKGGAVNYEAKVNNKELMFGADGHYIKQTKEAND